MAIRHSPGCKCCKPTGCQTFNLSYTPTSPLSRGELASIPSWQPVTLYNAGDRFQVNRTLDGDRSVFEVPATLQSGPAWIPIEEARYTFVLNATDTDQVKEWEPYGDGWAELTPAIKESALKNGYLFPRCGFISKEDVLPSTDLDWMVNFLVVPQTHNPEGGEKLDFVLRAKIENAESVDVNVNYAVIDKEYAPPGISPDPSPFKQMYFPFSIRLTSSGVMLDETWSRLNFLNFAIGHTKQPDGATIIAHVDVTTGPKNLITAMGLAPVFSALVVTGNGRLHLGTYAANNPDTYREVETGDVVVLLDPVTWTSFDAWRFVKKADIISDMLLLGGGMQVESPGSIPPGRKVAAYCNSANFITKLPADSWGLQLRGAQASRTRTVDEPTCRIIDPTACPCPNDSEFYPVLPSEGINKDNTAIRKTFDVAVYNFFPAPANGELLREGILGDLTTYQFRNDVCGYVFLKATVFESVWLTPKGTRFPPLFNPSLIDSFEQRLTFAIEAVRISWIPLRGRYVSVTTSATIAQRLYNITSSTEAGLLSLAEILNPVIWPDTYWLPASVIGAKFVSSRTFATGNLTLKVPVDEFPCSGWSIQGTYTNDDMDQWWDVNTYPNRPSNPIIGDTWTVTM